MFIISYICMITVVSGFILTQDKTSGVLYPTPIEPPKPYDQNCTDTRDDCIEYGQSVCSDTHEVWARENCARSCKFCEGPPMTPPQCTDKERNCETYSKTVCTDPQFMYWARDKCRRFCRFCPPDVLQQLDALISTLPPIDCFDAEECVYYKERACSGDNSHWVQHNCRKMCGLCTDGHTTDVSTCHDKISNCKHHEPSLCVNVLYRPWVYEYCRKTCGICTSVITTVSGLILGLKKDAGVYPTPKEPAIPYDQNCSDTKDDCIEYGVSMCTEKYGTWARANCARSCKFCEGPPISPPQCVDKATNCETYPKTVCTDPQFMYWARDKCRRFCRFCPPDVLQQLEALTSVVPPLECFDAEQCVFYTQSACSGDNSHWVQRNCRKFCGLCTDGRTTQVSACHDKITNCKQYEPTVCIDVLYRSWVDENCRKTCGICKTVETTTPDIHIPTPMSNKIPVLPSPKTPTV